MLHSEHHDKAMSAPAPEPAPAYGGFPADRLQALMSDNWTSPPNRQPFATTAEDEPSFPNHTPDVPSQLPAPTHSFGFPGPGPGPDPEQFSGAGFGSASAASHSGSALLVPAGSATAAPTRNVGNVDFTSTSTSTPAPTPRPFPTLVGLARQQDQALAALHSTFASPHYFNTTSFGAHLPDLHQLNPPNANAFFDQFATADFSPPPNFLQPPFFSPLHHPACELHVVPQFLRPAGHSSLPYSTPAPLQFGYYLQAPDLEVEGLDQRRDLDDRLHDEAKSPADESHARDGQEDDGVQDEQDEQGRIAVDSLLDDSMPVKKRARAASSHDEPAGPATIKRPRSQEGGAGVSSRRQIKMRKTMPTVVIPDSDDLFAEDDDGKQEMFDLTENDNLPEEHKVVKEDTSTKLCKFECSICLDTASSLTVTYCGHMYCGPCLHQAMHAEVTKRICPMCRQKIDVRPKNTQPAKMSKTFFHLELKLKPSKRQGKQPIRPMRRV